MIRTAKKDDYIEMDAIFRSSASELCSVAYGSEIVDAWVG